jgi:uncharacterized protein (TIGR00255 family)
MKSMTGFGKSELRAKVGKLSVEVSSVNNRFLEISTKLPRQFFALESRLRELVNSRLDRGKVYLYVGYEESDESTGKFAINRAAAKAYYQQLLKLRQELGIGGEIRLSDLMALPEFANPEKETFDHEMFWPSVQKVVEKALNALVDMRLKEGRALGREMSRRLKLIDGLLKIITANSSDFTDSYREKLTKRISQLLDTPLPDSARLEEEIVMVAERIDITEECTRLASHIEQFRHTLGQDEPVGKRLNFILQEMNREANTIASKCSSIKVSKAVISLKEEIEKLREQVQNVE